jgi:uncharacterized protein (TIGR01777 family)
MKICITGASGLVGTDLRARLVSAGHEVLRLVRRKPCAGDEARWRPDTGSVEAELAGGAIVHLAGEGIAEGRWTAAKMQRIRESRVAATRLLCEQLAARDDRPETLICASAVGYYGDRGEALLDESAPPGSGFLPDVCRQWEAATEPARRAGIRVVNLRIGVVLSTQGGALAKMLTPFRLGIGGRLGSGDQYMSWIALEDLSRAIAHCLEDPALDGPVNAVAPEPVTNAEFTRELGRALSRPAVFPVPAAAARLAFGKMAEDLLLASMRVLPERLVASGFEFRYPRLDGALAHLLRDGRPVQSFRIERETFVSRPLDEVFGFFSDPYNLEALTPPWLSFRVLSADGPLRDGALIRYGLRLRGVPFGWTSRLSSWEPPRRFVDEQVRGPYLRWVHEHTFEPADGGTIVRDVVDYDVPGGKLVQRLLVRRDVERIFDYRAARLPALLGRRVAS